MIKLINEEISDFDFLNNEKYNREKESVVLMGNEDFQKQFICDLLLNRNKKIKIIDVVQSEFDGNWENNGYLSINYIVELSYTYDLQKEPAKFALEFKGDSVSFSLDGKQSYGDKQTPPVDEEWFNQINWNDIDVKLSMIGERDDDIDFVAFKHAPERIRNLFIRDFLGDFIGEWAMKGMQTPADFDNVNKVGYC